MSSLDRRVLWASRAARRRPQAGEGEQGRSASSANHLGVLRGLVSAYSQNDVAGTMQRFRLPIRDWFRAPHDRTGNLPLFPAIFPDQLAPIVRNGPNGERELVMARWGMPGPPQFGGAPITNIRNVGSPHWRGWLACM